MSRTDALRGKLFDAVALVLDAEDVTDLERLRLLHQLHEHMAAEAIPAAVERCLDHGDTWAGVGDALGLRSRQAAQQQWGRRLTARRLM